MRYLTFLSLLAAVAACGSDNPVTPPAPPAPTTAPVYFRIDGVTCHGVDAITLYIDGGAVGTETLAAGGSPSSPHVTSIGSHALGAKEVNAPFNVWPTTVENISAAGLTFLLTC
jgi:hypothetical protein